MKIFGHNVTIKTDYMMKAVYFFLVVYMVMGWILFGVGIWTLTSVEDMKQLLNNSIISNAAILLILSGVLTLIIACVGAYAVRKEKRNIIVWVSISIVLVFILEISSGLYAFTHRTTVRKQLQSGINHAVSTLYGIDSPYSRKISHAMDWIQQNVECCGALEPLDWKNSSMWSSKQGGGNIVVLVPASCCKEPQSGCNQGKNMAALVQRNTIYTRGCLEPADVYIKSHFRHVGRIGLAVAFIQLIGIALVYGLSRKLNYRKKRRASTMAPSSRDERMSVLDPVASPQRSRSASKMSATSKKSRASTQSSEASPTKTEYHAVLPTLDDNSPPLAPQPTPPVRQTTTPNKNANEELTEELKEKLMTQFMKEAVQKSDDSPGVPRYPPPQPQPPAAVHLPPQPQPPVAAYPLPAATAYPPPAATAYYIPPPAAHPGQPQPPVYAAQHPPIPSYAHHQPQQSLYPYPPTTASAPPPPYNPAY